MTLSDAAGIVELLRDECPNCASAHSGGHPNPDEIKWCMICSDPKTGEVRGWVWRWGWLHRLLVSRHNFALVQLEQRLRLVRVELEVKP